ncbi:MAG: 2OG-Fe(II) oxygenase [Cypionkella sp.]|uniref:HalD/BesD family halogenase n=1 Tax=Cypionkella sp. TaxID=2811411 RepID=UPI0026301917|nr:2OG-Fe(II) oxygenase [Cypionkella sp.]MDB5659250.1 2OG-Fe(II) oxygenase [Cypionkella sp.]
MRDILDLDRYPLDKPGSAAWLELVADRKASLAREGMFNLEGLLRPEAVTKVMEQVNPIMERLSFLHKRNHNIYFRKDVPGLDPDHPALKAVDTINHTVCGDQLEQTVVDWVYSWPQMAVFLAATMDKETLFTMSDPLARMNIMRYGDGEALNWHFDRSEFTTTLLLQEPSGGGEFLYRTDLRSDTDPNYDGVAQVLEGRDNQVKSYVLKAGTLNVFKGKNTLHKVTKCQGPNSRFIAVFSYYDRPGVRFSREEQVGFYGRAA